MLLVQVMTLLLATNLGNDLVNLRNDLPVINLGQN